uniref:Uncharacterized protein n=1 Tax=Anopheles dirus TaxID=7168 RepID=A0A182NWW7_9DIPT
SVTVSALLSSRTFGRSVLDRGGSTSSSGSRRWTEKIAFPALGRLQQCSDLPGARMRPRTGVRIGV